MFLAVVRFFDLNLVIGIKKGSLQEGYFL